MISLNYCDRVRNLNIKNSSKVESNKFFPVFNINGDEYIFKPLSKTKPLTTSLFAYSEVFWSRIISNIVEAPIYDFAICNGYSNVVTKHYNNGTLVKNILKKDDVLINSYDYFLQNPDQKLNIKDYTNYCMMFYDYRDYFKTELLKNNKELAEQLAMHILLSILKGDENYHYENVQFIINSGDIRLAPMLDHEFSIMFLFHDCIEYNIEYYERFLEDIKSGILHNNIIYIKENFPRVVDKFKEFLSSISNFPFENNNDFLFDSNSFSYLVGEARYKENNEGKAMKLEEKYKMVFLDLEFSNRIINYETMRTIKTLIDIL